MKLIIDGKNVTKSLLNKILDKVAKDGIVRETDAAATILSQLLEHSIGRKLLAISVLSDEAIDEFIILMTVYGKLLMSVEKNNIGIQYENASVGGTEFDMGLQNLDKGSRGRDNNCN